ncbi:MAG: terminase [Acidobacteriaceae bacterium]|nr:terminase [Acidobacteriaceae bacterium]
MTTWVAGRFFLKTITAPGVLTVQVAQTREAAEGIFRMVQRFWECLPLEMRKGCLRRSRANVGQMIFPNLDSEFRVLSACDESAGRGLTVQNMHCSEVSRWPGDAAATLAGLRAALVPGGEMVIESTPNGAYGCFYEEWQQAEEKGVAKHFFPWWMEDAYVSAAATNLRADEIELKAKHDLTDAQIGFRRGLEASYRGLRTQEFAEDAELCFRSTGECCFDIEAVERRLSRVSDPVETRRDGALRIWLPALPDREYLVAVDTAGGGPTGDFAAVQVLDMATGMQCAELQQRIGMLELAHVAASLGREYGGAGGAALIAVERNNHGAGVLAYLDAIEKYAYVYEQAGVAGWLTSAGSKPAMISRMGALLVESPELFLSKSLLGECRTFISHPGGGTGAANGAHDDCLMAMAMGQAVRAERLQNGSYKMRVA